MGEHSHWAQLRCTDWRCPGPKPELMIPFGPISGLSFVARELMLHLGADPSDHVDVLIELEQEIGEALLDLGRDLLTEHNVPCDVPV